jgi:hypothetical protein
VRDDVRPVAEEEAPGGVHVEPLPESGEGATEEEVPIEETAPTSEPLPDESGETVEANEPGEASSGANVEASAQTTRVRVVSATCGENVRGAEGELAATVRRRGQALRIAIRDLSYYCQPAPRFSARVEGETVVVDVLPPEPGRPTARCVCLHDATIVVDEVPATATTVRIVEDAGTQGLSLPVPPA